MNFVYSEAMKKMKKIVSYSFQLKVMKPTKSYLVAIDSDGCVFDAMGIKQRECFCPMMIAYFNLQPVAQAARECKEFADLYSKTRGANRHKTMYRILNELLPFHPIVKERGFKVPKPKYYFEWINDSKSLLSNDGLEIAIKESVNAKAKAELGQVLKWSKRVDDMVTEVVKNIPPFKYAHQSLKKIRMQADIIVCSSTPIEAIYREWNENGIMKYPKIIAGQEMGTKAEQLAAMCEKYDKDKILMIGDAPCDQNAAKKNGILFYAINQGAEDMSWHRLYAEALDIFFHGKYAGKYENMVIEEFEKYLPEKPYWL